MDTAKKAINSDLMNKLALAIIYVVSYAVICGTSISLLWNWFIATSFEINEINWAVGTGISLIAQVANPNLNESSGKTSKNDLIKSAVIPVVAMILGWLLTFAM